MTDIPDLAWLRDRMVTQQFEAEMVEGAGNLLQAITESAGHQLGKAPQQLVLLP